MTLNKRSFSKVCLCLLALPDGFVSQDTDNIAGHQAMNMSLNMALHHLMQGMDKKLKPRDDGSRMEAFGHAFDMLETLLGGLGNAGSPAGAALAQQQGVEGNAVIPASFSDGGPDSAGIITVNAPEEMRGELASKSRVPIQWVIRPGATFEITFDHLRANHPIIIKCEGFNQEPFEGVELYKDLGIGTDPETWNGMDEAAKQKALKTELHSFYTKVEGTRNCPWKGQTSWFGKGEWLQSIKHKQMRIWYTIREMTGYSLALCMPSCSNAEKAFYPLMLAKPAKMEQIRFESYKNKGTRVSFVTSVDGPEEILSVYKQYNLEEKCNMLFDPVDFPNQRALVESKAQSAMNFAASMASGNPVICEKNKDAGQGSTFDCIEGGKPEKVIKFMEACEMKDSNGKSIAPKLEKSGWQHEDLTFNCQGSDPAGRVVWRLKSQYDQANQVIV